MKMKVTFPGNKRVDAEFNGFTVQTDQPIPSGGDNSAPSPFDYFLSSMVTCAGIFILGFCNNRNLPTDEIYLEQDIEFDPINHRLAKVKINIFIPIDFPEKYRGALINAANLCLVKRTIQDPPDFEIDTVFID